jgi:hypothetical protein
MHRDNKAHQILEYILLQGKGDSVPVEAVENRFEQSSPIIMELQNNGFISLIESRNKGHYEPTAKVAVYFLELNKIAQ